jgi:peroxiredoxin (alkyl hydroperoxide reductase subunit C)
MLTVGDQFPDFDLNAVDGIDTPFLTRASLADYKGHWLVAFFWPKDFTFVCPTEIAAFGQLQPAFVEAGAALIGVSIDSEYVHLAWREQHPGLRRLPFPMAADIKRELTSALGILDQKEGVALRATFIADPDGVIRFVSVNDLDTGRNVDEVLRSLRALQAGGLTSCGWQVGEAMLTPA